MGYHGIPQWINNNNRQQVRVQNEETRYVVSWDPASSNFLPLESYEIPYGNFIGSLWDHWWGELIKE